MIEKLVFAIKLACERKPSLLALRMAWFTPNEKPKSSALMMSFFTITFVLEIEGQIYSLDFFP